MSAPVLLGGQVREFGNRGQNNYRSQTCDRRQYLVRVCCCPEQPVIHWQSPRKTLKTETGFITSCRCSLLFSNRWHDNHISLKKKKNLEEGVYFLILQSIYILEVFHALAHAVPAPLVTELQNTLLIPWHIIFERGHLLRTRLSKTGFKKQRICLSR